MPTTRMIDWEFIHDIAEEILYNNDDDDANADADADDADKNTTRSCDSNTTIDEVDNRTTTSRLVDNTTTRTPPSEATQQLRKRHLVDGGSNTTFHRSSRKRTATARGGAALVASMPKKVTRTATATVLAEENNSSTVNAASAREMRIIQKKNQEQQEPRCVAARARLNDVANDQEHGNSGTGSEKIQHGSIWTQLEHDQLVDGITKHGQDYSNIAAFVPSRTENAVKRYIQRHALRRKADDKLNWTRTEHDLLVRGITRYGNKPTKLASLLPLRTENAVKRYIQRHALHNKPREEDDHRNHDNDHDDNEREEETGSAEDHVPTRSRTWTPTEHDALIRGLARYGNDHTKLATLVPRRTTIAVQRYIERHALNTLRQERESDNDDSNTSLSSMICEESTELVDDDRKIRNRRWTEQERNAVIRGMTLYGKDYNKLSTLVPRTAKAVRYYIAAHSLSSKSILCDESKELSDDNTLSTLCQGSESDNNDSNISVSSMICEESKELVVDVSNNRHRRWTEQERDTVIRGMALYNKDYNKLSTLVPRTAKAIKHYIVAHSLSSTSKLCEESKELSDDDDDDDDDDIYKDNSNDDFVQKKERGRGNRRWTIEEHNAIIRGMALYGKDYTKLSILVPRTRIAVSRYVIAHSLSSKSKICKESKDLGGDSRGWTDEERNTIIRGMALYGKDYNKLSTLVPTRTKNAIGKYIRKTHSLNSMICEENEEPSDDDGNTSDHGNEDDCVSRKGGEGRGYRRWTEKERNTIIRGMTLYGKDYNKLSTLVPARTANAIRKYIEKTHSLRSMICEENKEPSDDDGSTSDHGNEDDCVPRKGGEGRGKRRWTEKERNTIIRGMALYGKDYTKLSTLVPTRTANAIGKYIRAHLLSSTT